MMTDRYLVDLYEYIHEESEEQLSDKIAELFGVESKQVQQLIGYLDFADYIELTNAVNTGDKAKIQTIIGRDMVKEVANAYSAPAPTGQPVQAQTTTAPKEFKSGDKVNVIGDDGKPIEGEVSGTPNPQDLANVKVGGEDKVVKKSQLTPMEEELNRMKQLAGIDEEEVEEGIKATGKVTTMTPSFMGSAAIAGAVMSPRKQERLTRTKSDMKPGPDKGAKYNKGPKR